MAHNWQKWKSRFLICHCHQIYRVEGAVGLPIRKVYFRSQILERPSTDEYWNIFGVLVLPGNVIFTFFRMCWWHSEANNMPNWSSIVQYLCTSIWDLKYTFSHCDYLPHTTFHFDLIDFQLNTDISSQFCIFSPKNHLALLKDRFLKKMLLKRAKTYSFFFSQNYRLQ